jgi:hypothetical protein
MAPFVCASWLENCEKAMKIKSSLQLAAFMGAWFAATAQAGTVWNEDINGDLSSNALAPTPLTVSTGSNVVIGSTGMAGQLGDDRDYFHLTIPAGSTLTAITLLSNTFVSGDSSFMGMQVGPQVTATTAAQLVGFVHYRNDMIDTNLLPAMGLTSLPSGTYSVWVQELGGTVPYGFDFVITPVAVAATADAPLPLWAYVTLAAMLLAITLKYRQRRT